MTLVEESKRLGRVIYGAFFEGPCLANDQQIGPIDKNHQAITCHNLVSIVAAMLFLRYLVVISCLFFAFDGPSPFLATLREFNLTNLEVAADHERVVKMRSRDLP